MIRKEVLATIQVVPTVSIRTAARMIQESEIKILLICDDNERLLGTVTDGDIRRAVSDGYDLNGSIKTIMNKTPKVAWPQDNLGNVKTYMRQSVIKHLPKLDTDGRVVDLIVLDHYEQHPAQSGAVVLMAGGRGSRLMPLTKDTPKPLLSVGGKPVIERQIEQLVKHGFQRFYISINYLGHMLEEHFGDGSQMGIQISYIRESEPLGTAGALSLIESPDTPMIVMNGDIISKTDFSTMMAYFTETGVDATMGVREYHYTVPFGCVSLDERDYIDRIEEKPSFRHLINSGIYVLSPAAISRIPHNTFYDMPELFQILTEERRPVNTYHITEEWIDIGQKEDLLWAQKLFEVEDEFVS